MPPTRQRLRQLELQAIATGQVVLLAVADCEVMQPNSRQVVLPGEVWTAQGAMGYKLCASGKHRHNNKHISIRQRTLYKATTKHTPVELCCACRAAVLAGQLDP
jgi:hypothetical protein